MGRPWLFEFGAFFYGIMTAQKSWRDSCAKLARYSPPNQGLGPRRILDLGCGPGVSTIILAKELPQTLVIGVDLAPRMLTVARSYTANAQLDARIKYVLADATALPFAGEDFDLVAGHSFLYLVHDRAAVVREAHRVLRRGGKIASMEPRRGKTDWRVLAGHWREIRYLISVILWRPYSRLHGQFSDTLFRNLLEQAGFQRTTTELVQDGLGIIGSGEKE